VIKESEQVKGTGENGRIVKAISKTLHQLFSQLLQPVAKQKLVAPAAPKVFVPNGEVFTEEIKNSQMRIIAKRLAESLFTAPHYN
jgi:pyruvate dehydrogenase E2 component (dihydrolipoamide acetyltransferase)